MFHEITECRVCQHDKFFDVLHLSEQSLANAYPKKPLELPRYPLRLIACHRCFHLQLSGVVDRRELFNNYLYTSGTSQTLRDHFVELAQWSRSNFPSARSVLDIACNDGTLLDAFAAAGFETYGIDPASTILENVSVRHRRYYGFWPLYNPSIPQLDLITATNVLGHVERPVLFLKGCLDQLRPDGAIIIEVPNAAQMVDRCEWDTIYHEHQSYFSIETLELLASMAGGHIVHTEYVDIHGGSIRVAIQQGGSPAMMPRSSILPLLLFGRRVQRVQDDLENELPKHPALVAYGASAKLTVLCNALLEESHPSCVVDDNPLKQGRYVPGTCVPILHPDVLRDYRKPLSILMSAWNFKDEITRKIGALRGKCGFQDQLIFYVPKVSVIPLIP